MANAGVTVGSVWLDVLPSMRDFGSTLVNGTEQASRRAGQRAGQALAEGTQEGAQRNQGRAVAAGAAIGSFIGNAMVTAVGKVGDLIAGAIDLSAGQAKLTAQLGLTVTEGERYGRLAGQLYAGAYGESLDQVNEALAGVHRNISANLNDADLTTITKGVLNLASAFEVDVGGATAAVGQMLKTGLAPDAQTALNIITTGFQSGVDKAGDFLDTLNEYGTQFRKLGLDGATATGLLSQGLQAGARDADLVADALKEFSIRAIDGSKTTSDAYKTLGLDATAMASQIAKGGPEASKGLQTVLDRLRGIKDPVQQSATAVELFGTQAEDLGAALYALDPSSAVAALGDVGQAASNLDQTLGSTAQAQIESFMRTLQVTFVNILGGYVIPAITTLAAIIGPLLGPALSLVGGIISTVIVPALIGMGQWVQNNASWLLPLAAGFGVFVLALNAAAIATTVWGVATSVASGIVSLVRGAVIGFQVAMWLLNAAMSANPIGIIVALVAGLVAGLIVAWNTSETFRNVVTAVWEAIQVGAAATWAGIQAFFGWLGGAAASVGSFFAAGWQIAIDVFNTVVSAISTGAQAIGAAATWLWNTILSPVLSAIGLGIRILIAVVTTILVAPFVIAFNLIGMAATALWENRIKPAFDFIAAGGQLVATFLQTYLFTPIGIALSFLGGLFSAGASAGVSAFQTLQNGLLAVWTIISTAVFGAIQVALNVLVTGFNFWRDAVIAAWTFVQNGLMIAWNFINSTVIQPLITLFQVALIIAFNVWRDAAIGAWQFVQNALATAWAFIQANVFAPLQQYLIGPLVGAFNTARDLAVGAWNAIRDGIAAVWNFIRDSIWQPLVNFVTGTIPDAFRTAVDAIGRAWDAVKQATRAPIDAVINVVYNQGIVKVWNWVAGLVGLGTLAEYHLPGFARGGAVTGGTAGKDSVLAALMPGEYVLSKKAVNAAGGLAAIEGMHQFLKGGRAGASKNLFAMLGIPGYAEGGAVGATDSGGLSLGGLWEAVTGGISKVAGMFSSTQWGQVAVGMMKKLADGLWPALLEKVTGWFATLFVGPSGGDVGAVGGGDARAWIIAHESGGNPTARNPTSTASGLYQMINGTWKAYGGSTPTAAQASVAEQNAVADRYVAARYGSWENARAFWQTHHYYDAGGMLPTGWSSVYNGTGKPEPVLTNAQWQQIAQGTTGNDGALHERFDDLIDAVRNSRPITVEDRSGNPVETARAAQLALRLAR